MQALAWVVPIKRKDRNSETSQHIFPKLCTYVHKSLSIHLSQIMIMMIIIIITHFFKYLQD